MTQALARTLAALAALALCACPPASMTGEDAGGFEEQPVEFEGESSGSPPDFAGDIIDAGNRSVIDAGTAVVDARCCNLSFRIDVGDEPAGAAARLVGSVAPLSPSLALTKVDGGYAANACFPMVSSSYYVYEFEWTSSDADAGGLSLGDGGYLITTHRHSTYETSYPANDGSQRNYIPSVTNCAELDAGMGP